MPTSSKTTLLGTVAWFDTAKGFGFITPDERTKGQDVYVHFTSILGQSGMRRALTEGQRVEFDIITTRKGFAALNVRVLQ